MGNLQRNLGVLSDEKPFGGFRNEQHCLPSISKRLCDGAKVFDYGPSGFKSIHVGHCVLVNCIQRKPLTVMLWKGRKLLGLPHFKVLLDFILNL